MTQATGVLLLIKNYADFTRENKQTTVGIYRRTKVK